ncbi:ribosomal protein L6, alpha-beta domain-containing protein [Leucosporidium creatinivorum]|uniref:Ribosomal protein L6, alpha-beta domain-containing protein n=1 Tax=Leucosporidium creatinivorum TaxID=106004 RepID=A0A1Y2CEG5_9BASI|nr:ribosomal protein L6, alpha-beta domain-containing protein [Leucosporidium creatinivorum]
MRTARSLATALASRSQLAPPSNSLPLFLRPQQARPFSSSPARPSHVGSLPIPCPTSVTLTPTLASTSPASKSTRLRVQGPKGELAVDLMPFVHLEPLPQSAQAAPHYSVRVDDPTVKHQRAVWGLTRSLLANAIVGVSTGYSLSLRLVGVGYRAAVEPIPPSPTPVSPSSATSTSTHRLNLKLGYAHPVLINLPADVVAATPSTTTITLTGIDKQRLGEVAARIRSWRVPEPYNGKGIFVGDEVVRRKEVKKK